jgi:hypothetical protein
MGALRLIDAAPEEVVLLGVQPASTDWGTVLTPEVETARHALMQAALAQLAQWTFEASALSAPATKSRDIGVLIKEHSQLVAVARNGVRCWSRTGLVSLEIDRQNPSDLSMDR